MEGNERPKDRTYLEKTRYNVRVRLKRRRFLNAYCPKCTGYLIKDNNVQLLAETEEGGKEVLDLILYLNIYEAANKHEIVRAPRAELKDVECPICNQSLVHTDVLCGVCGSRTAELSVAAVHIQVPFLFCLKQGCHWHGITPEDELLLIQDSSREW